jgi:hypothetical protein
MVELTKPAPERISVIRSWGTWRAPRLWSRLWRRRRGRSSTPFADVTPVRAYRYTGDRAGIETYLAELFGPSGLTAVRATGSTTAGAHDRPRNELLEELLDETAAEVGDDAAGAAVNNILRKHGSSARDSGSFASAGA